MLLLVLLLLSPFLPSIYLSALSAFYSSFGHIANLASSMKVFGSSLFILGNYLQGNPDTNANTFYYAGVICLTAAMCCFHPTLGPNVPTFTDQKEVILGTAAACLVWCFMLLLPSARFVALAPLFGSICLSLVAFEKMSFLSLGTFTAAIGQMASSGFLFGNSWIYLFYPKPTSTRQTGSLCKVLGSLLLFTANALNMDWQSMKADNPFVVVTATNLLVLFLTIWVFSSFRREASMESKKIEQKEASEVKKAKQPKKAKGKK